MEQVAAIAALAVGTPVAAGAANMIRQVLVVSAIGLAAWRPPADACSCSEPSVFLDPQDGALGVPTNVVFAFGPTTPSRRINLYEKTVPTNSWEPSPKLTSVAVFTVGPTAQRIAPPVPLQPNTDYLLNGPGAYGTDVNFRTGSGPDTQPPTIEDFSITWGGSAPIRLPMLSCGGAYEWIQFQPIGAADNGVATSELTYDFYSAAAFDQVNLSQVPVTLGRAPQLVEGGCWTNFPVMSTKNLSGMLVAVDLAGNRSNPTPVKIIAASGCGCSSAGSLLPFAAALLLTRRRRWLERGTFTSYETK